VASKEVAGYSGTPLLKKLGLGSNTRVLLVNAPPIEDFAVLKPVAQAPYDLIVVFCPDRAELHSRFAPLANELSPAGALWVCWPKKASGVPTDLTDQAVRAHGLEGGLVDVKVAAIDTTWSGLKFVRRVSDR
jgi:hypothetical protein